MNWQACSCGAPSTITVVIYGCIVERCHPCAVALCDPLGAPQ